MLDVDGDLVCATTDVNHALFTSMNEDDNAGEQIAGSSNQPSSSDVNVMLSIASESACNLRGLTFHYVGQAVIASGGLTLEAWHSKFAHIGNSAIAADDIILRNVGVYGGFGGGCEDAAFYAYDSLDAENVTVHGASHIWWESLSEARLKNCLFTSSGNLGSARVLTTEGVEVVTSPATSPYYIPEPNLVSLPAYWGYFGLYLVNSSPYRNEGVTTIDADLLADIRKMTTYWPGQSPAYAPVDTLAPDLGYHYPVFVSPAWAQDTDGDGMVDGYEDANSNEVYDAGDLSNWQTADTDADGLNDLGEYLAGTDPKMGDTDGDGLSDGYEANSTQTNPTLADTGNTGTSDGYKDPDSDGLTNLEEFQLGKNPLVPNVGSANFSPVGGSFGSAQNVVITCPTASATIRYTTDGSEPTTSSTTIASGSSVAVSSSVTLKAKAWKTSWTTSDTESQGYSINGPANQAPTVTVSPSGSVTFLASETIEILVEAEDADGTIAWVQLYRGTYKVAETTSSVLRHTVANVPSGTYTFTAKAVDDDGAVTSSSSVTLTIGASGPVVSLVGAQPFFTSSPGSLIARITGVNPGGLSTLTLNGGAIPKRTGEFTIPVALTEGENTFTLLANGTFSATAKVYLDSTAPVIAITAPANNTTFNTTRVNVSGTFTESSLKQITVNGVLAFIGSGTFTALNVPLATGANTITAIAEDIAGNSTSTSINLNGDTTLVDPVQLAATPVGGFATLSVTFTPTASTPGGLRRVLYDFDGNGTTDHTESNLDPISHNYAAGEYFPVVTVQTTAGKFSSLGGWNSTGYRLRINVQAAPQQVGSAISITDPVDLKTTANGHLYILSRSGATIYEYDATPTFVRSVAISGTTPTPTGLDVDANGNLYVAISGQHKVAKYKLSSGSYVLDTTFDTDGLIGSSGSGDGQFNTPYDVAVSPDGTEIAVSDSGNHRIQRFSTADGSFLGTFGSSGSGVGQFNTPKGLTYDGAGYLYIVDSGNNRLALAFSCAVIGTSGSSGTGLGYFQGAVNLCVGSRGIYVGETANSRVQIFDPLRGGHSGASTPFSTRLSLSSQLGLSQPNSIAPVADFLAEKIYIADTGNGRVIKATLPETSAPDTIWNTMTASFSGGNIDQAVSHFSSTSAEDYRRSFISVGATATSSVTSKTLTPAVINGASAQYYFEDTSIITGETITFPVEFVKENGVWKISEF